MSFSVADDHPRGAAITGEGGGVEQGGMLWGRLFDTQTLRPNA